MGKYAGIDIGGTKCAVTLANTTDANVEILRKERFDTDITESPESIIDRFCEIIDSFDGIEGIGISCGGPLSSQRGLIMSPPTLPLWNDIPIVDILSKKYSVPVRLQNDANACAIAEWRYGAGRGCDSMVFLTFGTGFGAGLILDGRLYSGIDDMAGEIGHIRLEKDGPIGFGKKGSCEGFCSGGGLKRLATSIAEKKAESGEAPYWYPDFCDAKSVAEAAYKGDETALEVYRICGEKLGSALSIVVDLLNPERIVIGSIFARSGDLIRPHMEKVMQEECLSHSLKRVEVLPATLGEQLGDYAAVCVARGGY